MSDNIKYKLKHTDPELIYNPSPNTFSFYQICIFPRPDNKLCSVRKIIYNEKYEIIDIKNKDYTKKKINNFTDKTKSHRYKLYSTYDIDLIDLPGPEQVLNANSDLLNNVELNKI